MHRPLCTKRVKYFLLLSLEIKIPNSMPFFRYVCYPSLSLLSSWSITSMRLHNIFFFQFQVLWDCYTILYRISVLLRTLWTTPFLRKHYIIFLTTILSLPTWREANIAHYILLPMETFPQTHNSTWDFKYYLLAIPCKSTQRCSNGHRKCHLCHGKLMRHVRWKCTGLW